MIQNDIYAFLDHGNGMEIAKFDRAEGNSIYTFASINSQALSFSGPFLWGTGADAGTIRTATVQEIAHLLLCIAAGIYVI